jgi:uncharacterized protein YfaS (alpha-2-macroglobulin family)
VRRDFSPTLCFVPEAIVGLDGKARLLIPLKDSITTWRLRLVASAASGATGVGEGRIRVSQPLHAEPWVATHVTVGDDLELPVAVRNETGSAMSVALGLRTSSELAVVGSASASLPVGPGGTGSHAFRIRAVAAGEARVHLVSDGGSARDAIERVIHVRPNAREVTEAVGGALGAGAPLELDLPPLAASVPRERRVSVYSTPVAEVLAGLEGLIACPHG